MSSSIENLTGHKRGHESAFDEEKAGPKKPRLSSNSYYGGINPHKEVLPHELDKLSERINTMTLDQIFPYIVGPSQNKSFWKLFIDGHPISVYIFPSPNDSNHISPLISNKSNCFLRTLAYKTGYIFIDDNQFFGNFLFTELPLGNLSQIIDNDVTNMEIEKYLNDVFEALSCLAHENLFPKQLDINDVYIVRKGNSNKAVLGCLGGLVENKSFDSILENIHRFLRSLLPKLESSKSLNDSLQKAHKLLIAIREINITEKSKTQEKVILEIANAWNAMRLNKIINHK